MKMMGFSLFFLLRLNQAANEAVMQGFFGAQMPVVESAEIKLIGKEKQGQMALQIV